MKRTRFGSRSLSEIELAELRTAEPGAGSSALAARLEEDGYLLIRGLHDPALVLEARRQMLEKLAAQGALDSERHFMDAPIPPGGSGAFRGGHNELTRCPAFQELVRGRRCLEFFSELRGGPAMTFDYQWLRVVGRGEYTGAHFDTVYMGRGTPRLLSMWTPLGRVRHEHGPLALCVGSHQAPEFARLRDTYGKMDVDRDRVRGWFSEDPLEIEQRFAGKWATSEFEPGDALIFGMFTLHASLTNVTDDFRLSSDTRYQLACEPFDERWVGKQPKGHYAWFDGEGVPMTEKRAQWGV